MGLQGLRTTKGITAMQMDKQQLALPRDSAYALLQAQEGRMFILNKMLEQIPAPALRPKRPLHRSSRFLSQPIHS